MGSSDGRELLCKECLLFRCDFLYIGKIPFCLGIQVNEADDTETDIPLQGSTDGFKSMQVVFNRVLFRDEDRIIAP